MAEEAARVVQVIARSARAASVVAALVSTAAGAQQRGAPPGPPPAAAPAQPGPRVGRGRGAVQVMTLTTAAWPDGGRIPPRHSQAGGEQSPPLAWSNAPEGVVSYALVVHDVDAATGGGTDDLLHWLVWDIPGASTSLPEGVPATPQLPDGTRQIGATGPGYRGPGALASGPPHHYLFELFALDTLVDVPAVGAPPPQTRAAVMAAMAGHVRGKAVLVGLFRR